MIKKLFFFFTAFLPLLLAAQKTKVLFIGNSYTYVNDLPQTFHDLALSKGDTVVFDASAVGGYRFSDHLSDANTLSKINLRPWDYVALQDQSQWPSFPPSQVASGVYPYAKRLDSLIHLNSTCTETIFYMTWGRKNGDAGNCAGYPPVCTFNGMNARLRESYLQMSQDNHASTSPVGVAWKRVRDTYPAIELYLSDESHPTMQGTYLAACVFYATIFHKSPVGGIIPTGVSATEALQLQSVAASTVLDSLSNWQQYGNIPNAAFSYTANGTQVHFTNLSTNALIFLWTFDDNTTSTQANPVHTYSTQTTHSATLTASNNCRYVSTSDTLRIQQIIAGIRPYGQADGMSIAPNPASDYVSVDTKNSPVSHFKIMDVLGKTIFYREEISGKEKINSAGWPEGVYYISYSSDKGSFVKKIIKQ